MTRGFAEPTGRPLGRDTKPCRRALSPLSTAVGTVRHCTALYGTCTMVFWRCYSQLAESRGTRQALVVHASNAALAPARSDKRRGISNRADRACQEKHPHSTRPTELY